MTLLKSAKQRETGENDERLALPFDLTARYGDGLDSAVVLGGGGLFFIAWQLSYLRELQHRRIDAAAADRIVGTSAGSAVGVILAARRLDMVYGELAAFSKVPWAISALSQSGDLRPSQERALELFRTARDAEPKTLRSIGYAALAADTPAPSKLRRTLAATLPVRGWPSSRLHIVAVDSYSTERLVFTKESRVPISTATAASCSVPGLFGPQPVGERKCVDGGVSGSGTHADLAVGARRVLILSLAANQPVAEARMTIAPGQDAQEAKAIEEAGGHVLVRGPASVDLDDLMSPKAIPEAMAMGREQAAADAPALTEIWQ